MRPGRPGRARLPGRQVPGRGRAATRHRGRGRHALPAAGDRRRVRGRTAGRDRAPGRRRARPPDVLPRTRAHHGPVAARPGTAHRHRPASAGVREPAHRLPACRGRRRRAGGAQPGAVPDLVLADARPAHRGPYLVPGGHGARPRPVHRAGAPRPPGVAALHRRPAPVHRRIPRRGPARCPPRPSRLHGHRDGGLADPRGAGQATGRHPGLRARHAADLPGPGHALVLRRDADRRCGAPELGRRRHRPDLPGHPRLRLGAGRRPADARQPPRQPHRLGGGRRPRRRGGAGDLPPSR